MAHPIINLTGEPSTDCPNPAYNCVQYCFEDPDFELQAGTRAQFIIELSGTTGYAAALNITVAGQSYTTVHVIIAQYKQLFTKPILTAPQFATKCKEAFESNTYLFNTFTFAVVGNQLIATARKVGELENFDFDFSALSPNPLVSSTNGTNQTFRENYGLVVEIWKSFGGATVGDSPISSESYTPNSDGTFCINIGEKVAPLLETRYVFDENLGLPWFADGTIIDTFIVRYGRSYSDNVGDCEVESRNFVSAPEIKVINSAFQKRNADELTTKICEGEWMSNMPQYTQVCENTDVVMWINLFDILAGLGGGELLHPYILYTYTDGTNSDAIGGQFVQDPLTPNDIYAVSFSASNINFFADPLKTIRSFELSVIVKPTNTVYASQHFKRVSCCKGDITFQFLNEFGGYDPILFTQITAIDLEQESTPFEGFLDCGQNGLRGGVDIVGHSANPVYTVTSKFVNNYNNYHWIREFLNATKRYVFMKVDGVEIQSKVISLSNTTRYFSQDNTLLITLQFTLNESLNLHKN